MKKIINDIIVSSKKPPKTMSAQKHSAKKSEYPKNKKSIKIKLIIWLFALACIIALFLSISMIFTSVMVTIKPKIQPINFNNEVITAKLKTSSSQDLPFEVISIDKINYKTVESTGEKHVELKASGKITIYNSYNSSEQILVSNTRFSSEDGRIYRLNETVTIPGMKKVNGKNIPGNIVADVIADKAGETYNIKASELKGNLKILGFKGSTKYESFYATLNENLIGGFIGQQKTITPEKEQELTMELKNDLQKLLMTELKTVKPESYLSFDNLNYIKYSPLSQENDDSRVKVGMKATLNAITFNGKRLATYIATKKISDFNKLPVNIIIPDNFSIKIESTSTEPWLEKNLDILLTGTSSIKWIYNSETLKTDLVGRSWTELPKIKTKYSGSISDLEARFTPFWQRFFPDDILKIKIEE